MKTWIYDLSFAELKEELKLISDKLYLPTQIFQWLYQKNIQDIKEWTNISQGLRDLLIDQYETTLNQLVRVEEDRYGTKKFLFEMADKTRIESVLIVEKIHYTFCVSTQIGCPLDCSFCSTGKMGFRRNLTSGEIICQILAMKKAFAYKLDLR